MSWIIRWIFENPCHEFTLPTVNAKYLKIKLISNQMAAAGAPSSAGFMNSKYLEICKENNSRVERRPTFRRPPTMNLSRPSTLPEVMHDPALPRAEYERCLHNLAAVNRVTLTHRPTLRWLDLATRGLPAFRSVSILDAAFVRGDPRRAGHR